MPDPTLTRLQRIMRLAYEMRPDEEAVLAREIYAQRQAAWVDAIREEARRVGVKVTVPFPRGEEADLLRRASITDAHSIVRTYNRDLERQIAKLYAENPRGNRYYYIKRIEQWHTERAAWKHKQIALMNDKTARYWAQQAFIENNRVSTHYRFAGPAPVCSDCATKFLLGIRDQAYVDENPTPLHPNCPHFWRTVGPRLGVPRAQVWVG